MWKFRVGDRHPILKGYLCYFHWPLSWWLHQQPGRRNSSATQPPRRNVRRRSSVRHTPFSDTPHLSGSLLNVCLSVCPSVCLYVCIIILYIYIYLYIVITICHVYTIYIPIFDARTLLSPSKILRHPRPGRLGFFILLFGVHCFFHFHPAQRRGCLARDGRVWKRQTSSLINMFILKDINYDYNHHIIRDIIIIMSIRFYMLMMVYRHVRYQNGNNLKSIPIFHLWKGWKTNGSIQLTVLLPTPQAERGNIFQGKRKRP